MEKVFTAKKDKWITWMLLILFALTFAATYLLVPFDEIPIWIHLLLLGCGGFIYWAYIETYTIVQNQELIQKAGPFKWVIPVENIKKIRKQGTHMINDGTWSSDKIDIIHKNGILSIAPEDKNGLIKLLVSKNKKIEVV